MGAREPVSAPRDAGVPQRRAMRAAAQRDRILSAAEGCFVREGFHAASMAKIAEAAQMSPGLIYRYFPGKHAIVLAIIERELEHKRAKIAKLHDSDFATAVLQAFEQWKGDDASGLSVPLFLSMHADALRDREIGEALTASDRASRADFVSWLTRSARTGGRGLRRRVAEPRAVLLQCLIEGLAIRAAREPDLEAAGLEVELRRVIEGLIA